METPTKFYLMNGPLYADDLQGRWGNGDVEVGFENLNQLDDVMELIEQAFDKQM